MNCSIIGCPNPHNAKGYCGTHYRRFRLYGDPLGKHAPKYASDLCSVDGCSKRRERLEWCQMHWWRWKHYGDLSHYPYQDYCSVDGCDRPHAKNGFCGMHNQRMKSTGTTADPVKILDPKRYRQVKRPNHPLAQKNGKLFEHRMVLYDYIGPGSHTCHWCGRTVTWETPHGEPGALVVDHLDHDRHNNVPSNLLPCCVHCNTSRTRRSKSRDAHRPEAR